MSVVGRCKIWNKNSFEPGSACDTNAPSFVVASCNVDGDDFLNALSLPSPFLCDLNEYSEGERGSTQKEPCLLRDRHHEHRKERTADEN